jgi:hypothetical protein
MAASPVDMAYALVKRAGEPKNGDKFEFSWNCKPESKGVESDLLFSIPMLCLIFSYLLLTFT